MSQKIYTRTGDKGTTSLFSGERVSKHHHYIDALGTIDEGNSCIGFALSLIPQESKFMELKKQLELIQNTLFDVGAAVATPRTCHEDKKKEKTRFDHEGIDLLEQWIDLMESHLVPLKQFILPGGHPAGAALHVSRGIIRRAERCVTPLFEDEEVTNLVLIYLNRLSDYLFVASRYLNHLLNIPETTWQAHKIN